MRDAPCGVERLKRAVFFAHEAFDIACVVVACGGARGGVCERADEFARCTALSGKGIFVAIGGEFFLGECFNTGAVLGYFRPARPVRRRVGIKLAGEGSEAGRKRAHKAVAFIEKANNYGAVALVVVT